jgi:hypothetical protein
MSRFTKFSFAALALTLAATGCQERAPRSFVQPNVLKKADIADGTWYYLQTVTDAPPTSSFLFVGNSSELMKIKFDIQEQTLFARRAYEQIQGSEDAYTQDPAKYAGQPVAAWPITSQFDIIRDYNATTGEETNRIIESTERPWQDREFIRVDWGNNLLSKDDVVALGINFFANDANIESASYWESDPSKPDGFHLERADQTDTEFQPGEANYLDVTNKWVVSPTQTTLSIEENGVTSSVTVPACFLPYQTDDCSSQVVKVRHAFAKLSPSHQYQPRNWDGKQMELFGIWDVGLNRLTYNRQYGVTNSGFNRHAARFNLWEKSYGDDGKTPIPYEQRTTRKIPYYAESSLQPFPPELFDTGAQIIKSWDEAIRCAVADVQTKVLKDSNNNYQCDISQVPQIYYWCHSPVKLHDDSMGPADDPACQANLKPQLDAQGNTIKDSNGDPIYQPRQGDPRRSTIFWVNQEQNAGPLGYGPPLFDVETGETISGQAYIYGAALDTYAARSRDLVLLLNGKIDPTDYVNGANVKDWVTSNRAGASNTPKTYSNADVAARAKAMNFNWAKGQAPEAPIDTSNFKNFLASLKNREDAMYKGGVFGQNNADLGQLKRDKLKGSVLEGMMVNSDIMQLGAAGVGTDWTTLSEAEKLRVSPLRSQAVREAINARLDAMRAFGYDFADFADEGVAQRAFQLAHDPSVPNLDPEAIRQKLRKDIFLAVTLHEVGHNMGLRHNFRASWDSMNYFDQYWQLRSGAAANPAAKKFGGFDPSTGQPIALSYNGGAACTDPTHMGKMRPRYIDCPGGATSVDEFMGGVREYQYSSIMDYGAEFNSDLQGLGKYDKAAMKFSYAGDGYVEVFTDAKTDQTSRLRWAALHAFQNAFGFPSPIGLTSTLESINYTTYPDLFNTGVAAITQRKDVPFSAISGTDISGYFKSDTEGNPIVPYYFCSDEFVGNLTCARFDSGADAYEQATDIISRYENFYLLNNFKRDRYTFHTSLAYRDRIASRYMDQLRNQLTWYALLRADFTDFFGNDSAFFSSEDGWGSFTQGVSDGFDTLGRVIAKPEAGSFQFVAAANSTDYNFDYYKKQSDDTSGGQPGSVAVGLLDGKYINTTWDFDGCGYYWADECQTRIGYFVDKTVALDVLSQSQAYFTGRDTSTDVRKYAIGYILPFQAQLQEKIGALLAGDYTSLAPKGDLSNPNAVKVTLPTWTLDQTATTGAIFDPAGGFTLQLYAGVYGLSTFPTTFDQSFIDTTKIFVVGNGEAPVSDSVIMSPAVGTTDPTQLVSYINPATGQPGGGTREWFYVVDPDSGKTYAAHATKPASQVLKSGDPPVYYRNDTGVRMLQTYQAALSALAACGNPTQCAAKQQAAVNYKQNLDVMRSLHNAFGYGIYKTDAPFWY